MIHMLSSNWMAGCCINRKRCTKIWIQYGMRSLPSQSRIHFRVFKSKCSIMIGGFRMISSVRHYLISPHSSCHESLNSWFRLKIQRSLPAQMQRVKVSWKVNFNTEFLSLTFLRLCFFFSWNETKLANSKMNKIPPPVVLIKLNATLWPRTQEDKEQVSFYFWI